MKTPVLLIVLSGLLGGLIRFVQVDEHERLRAYVRETLLALAAASVVPLFLEVSKSPILSSAGSDAVSGFVFFGFCMLAALNARVFLSRVARTALGDATEAKRLALDAQAKAEKTTRALIAATADVKVEAEIAKSKHAPSTELAADEARILDVFENGRPHFLSGESVGVALGKPTEQVDRILAGLKTKGLVDTLDTGDLTVWNLTIQGRIAMRERQRKVQAE